MQLLTAMCHFKKTEGVLDSFFDRNVSEIILTTYMTCSGIFDADYFKFHTVTVKKSVCI